MAVEMRYEERTDADNIPPLPEALEQKIKINKDAETLGLQVDIEEGGVNGMVVRSVTRGGTLARDGRVQPGDYLVAVNRENMRGVSHSQAHAVLRRAQTVPLGGEIPIIYIPATDAVVFRTSVLTKVACGEAVETREAKEVRRRSRSRSLDRKGATIININHDDPEIPPISSPPAAPQPVQAPLVSPETDMSPSDLSTSVTANVRSFEKISLKSVTTDESSTDPEPSAAVSPPPAPLARILPEAAPRTSLLSDSRQSSLNRPGSAKSLSVSGEEVSHVTAATSPSSPSKHWGPERTVEMDTAIPVPEPGQYRDTTAGSSSVPRNTETSTTTQQQQQLHGDDQGKIGQNLGLTEDVALKLIMQALENHPNTASFQSGMAALSQISHKLKDKPHYCENVTLIPNIRKYLPQSLMDLLDTVSTGAAPAHSPAQSIPSTSSGDTVPRRGTYKQSTSTRQGVVRHTQLHKTTTDANGRPTKVHHYSQVHLY